MDLLDALKERSLTVACWWAASCAVFFVLTKLWPCNPGQSWWKAPWSALTDFVYGLLLLPATGLVGRVVLLWVGVTILYPKDATPEFTARSWPLWVQCALILLIQDALMYWAHRLFHTRHGWGFHAVHHSPETLDWTAASRLHPVNEIAQYSLADAAVLLMGFSPAALVVLLPLGTVYSALVHANLNWTFGPLRYVLASPVFHRWHHSTRREARDKNFAPTFPFLDLLWGTFYMPAGVLPDNYGADEPAMPAGPVGQMLYPFRGAGRWAVRNPVVALGVLLATAGVGYSFWQYLNRPVGLQAGATPPADGWNEPPAFLPPSVTRDPHQTTAVAVNATGLRAIYGRRDGSVVIRDTATGRELSPGLHQSPVNAVAIGPDGKAAVSAGIDGTVQVFDAGSGEVRRVLSHHGTAVKCVAVGDDGWVATGGVDGVIRLWDSQGGLVKQCKPGPAPISAVALSDGGRRVVAGQGTQVCTWDVGADRLVRLRRLSDLAYCVGISGDGRTVAAGEYTGQLHLWEFGREQPRLVLNGHAGPIYSLWVSPDGASVVTGGADRVVRVWNAGSGAAAKELPGHAGMVFSVSYDVRRRRVLAGGKDGSLTSWDVPGGAVVPASGSLVTSPQR